MNISPPPDRLRDMRTLQVGESRLIKGKQSLLSPTAYRAFGKGNFKVRQGPSTEYAVPVGWCRVWRTG